MRRVDRPTPLPDGAKVLHIGPAKTGTSALQAAFDAARGALADQGVDYVSRSRNPLALAGLVARGRLDTAPPAHRARWDRLSARFRSSAARHAVLSSEGFAHASAETAAEIVSALGPDVHVLVTLRPLAGLLPSLWQQITREGNTIGYSPWLDEVLAEGDPHPLLACFDPARLISVWGEAVGQDRLILLCPDPADRAAHLDAVGALLDTPGALRLQPVRDASPPYAEVEVLRHVNLVREREYPATGDDAERWRRAMRQAGRQLGDQRTVGERLRLPRWAAERVDDRTHAAIAAVEASDVLVIGDLAHLVTDPRHHDAEVPEPTHVPVGTAGRIAGIVARSAVAELGAPAARRIDRLESSAARLTAAAPASLDDLPAHDLASTLTRRLAPGAR